jgi:acyl-CoA thioesterase FadM
MTTTGWLETYRGVVARWELDNVDHFTVAFYFERLEHAMLGLLESVGLGPDYMARARHGCVPLDTFVRYTRELRMGDILHMDSGVIDADEAGLHLGHKLFDSETRTVCATFEQRLSHVSLPGRAPAPLSTAQRRAIEVRRVAWDGPTREVRRAPKGLEGFVDSGRDVVKPLEVNLVGESALSSYVHRFSAAGGHLMADIGFTPAYMRNERRGFSTFEFQLSFGSPLVPGTPVQVKSALLHVGSSSLHMCHQMHNGRTGEHAATLHQLGVHLDMNARRPAPLPEAIRAKAKERLAPSTPGA